LKNEEWNDVFKLWSDTVAMEGVWFDSFELTLTSIVVRLPILLIKLIFRQENIPKDENSFILENWIDLVVTNVGYGRATSEITKSQAINIMNLNCDVPGRIIVYHHNGNHYDSIAQLDKNNQFKYGSVEEAQDKFTEWI
jgi:hypothetical protein